MCSKRDIIIFLAGAQAFHLLSHVLFMVSGILPIKIFGFTLTRENNTIITVINIIITVGLIWWASIL